MTPSLVNTGCWAAQWSLVSSSWRQVISARKGKGLSVLHGAFRGFHPRAVFGMYCCRCNLVVYFRLLRNPVQAFCDPTGQRWAFEATVYKSQGCRGFVGSGDADPANVSPLVRGAEMRVAETRAVNRSLRKAYGIGICSIEEIGTSAAPSETARASEKLPPKSENGNGYGGPKVRDRLCQIIRQHQLDATLVKSYSTDFCGVKSLREATRQQVENFVVHLADWAEKDRNALLCQLNSYLAGKEKEGAA